MNGPCPVCEWPDGFHDPKVHLMLHGYVSEAVKRRRQREQDQAAEVSIVDAAGTAQG